MKASSYFIAGGDSDDLLQEGLIGLYKAVRDYRRDKEIGQGKLRLLYEAAPMAFLVEQAGGLATTGDEDILDIQPTGLHQRVPVILGSREDVETFLRYRS